MERPLEEHELRLSDDLGGLTTGEVRLDDLTRGAYSCDASILQVRPAAVVMPKSVSELAAIIRYAADNNLPIHPRGAGTGLSGESLGSGIVIDISRYFTRIVEIGPDFVVVEPGVRLAVLQQELARIGRMIAVDPISGDRCTIGGMVATNAAGPHSLRYGTIRDHILSARAILANGELVELSRIAVDTRDSTEGNELGRIAKQLARILAAHAQAIQEEQPPSLIKHGGYELRGIYDGRTIDLARLMAGSEGTLAFCTEFKLATIPIPAYRGMLLATFPTLQAAADAVVESLEYQPTACELLDRRLLSLVREAEPWYREWMTEDAEALLLIEHEGSSPDNVVERIVLNQNRLNRVKRLAVQTQEVYGEPNLAVCWRVRDRAMPRLTRASDNVLPIPFVENTAVPPNKLPEFLAKVQNIMKSHGVTATYSSHAGVGILHTRPLLDIHRESDRQKMRGIVEDVFEAVTSCGGTCNGEHGVGLLRSGLLPKQYPRLYPAFQRIKSVFDPYNVFNPGRIVGAEQSLPLHLIRPMPHPSAPPSNGDNESSKFQLRWPQLSIVEMAERCNGCNTCQSCNTSVRMCPTNRAFAGELYSPRAINNLMRQILQGEIDGQSIGSIDFREMADHCVYCKMCRMECPSSVDVSKLMLEAKAANIAEQGLSRIDWFFSGWDRWSRWGSSQAHFANQIFASPITRWMIEKTFGLSRHRRLFRFQHRTFTHRAKREGWTRKPRSKKARGKVALFVDTYTNHYDPELGEAVARLLHTIGHLVYFPQQQRSSGMPYLLHGDIESARARLLWNFEIAAELVREGYTIVTTEPSAALMFRDEARHLMSDADLEAVASNTFEVSEFLALQFDKGHWTPSLDNIPITVAYHEPCHQRALELRSSPASLLRRIPDLRLIEMDLGCSGMAGTHGMRVDSYKSSLQSGSAMLARLSRGDVLAGTTQCGSCRMQMEEGSLKPTLHPAKLLAVAVGLVDNPAKLFRKPNRGLLSL
ncbi:FAD-binding protein [bacterium]|nr:FAD-binding protein [bacterium]